MKKMIAIGEAAELCGVSVDTLRSWDNRGYLLSARTAKGHRRYFLEEIERWIEICSNPIVYCMNYDNFKPLPDEIMIISSIDRGDLESSAVWTPTVDPLHDSFIHCITYRKSYFFESNGKYLFRNVVFKGDGEYTGWLDFANNDCLKLNPRDDGLPDVYCLNLHELWEKLGCKEKTNRETVWPDAFYGREIREGSNNKEVVFVKYDRLHN